jgi:membrane protease subunit HflK
MPGGLALFFRRRRSYKDAMSRIFRWGRRFGALLSENRGPWGSGGGDGGEGGGDEGGEGGGPRNPWGQPRKRRPARPGNGGSIDDFIRRGRERFGGRFPQDGRPYWLYGLIAFLLIWVLFTSVHRIGPRERGVVTVFGRYWSTLQPGIGLSWPAPIGSVETIDVDVTREFTIPDGTGENLILTGDQNVIDLSYTVRWNINDPQLFLYQLADAERTIKEVAESAVRAVVSRTSLNDAIGAGRSGVDQRVQQTIQEVLNDYRAGVTIRGVAINQSAPPAAVNPAFLEVSAAQQQAQSYVNAARGYAVQRTAAAQGEASAFDKVYAQYRAAPEVTRRRMYYETMERILSRVDSTIIQAPGVNSYLPLPQLQRRARPQAERPQ